jgi:hypothetical protein
MSAQEPPFNECLQVPPSMSRIGLVAYCALPPHLVFVRVPNEPGRWVLTDRCVVDVACPVCGAQAGEPCHNRRAVRRYGTGTHADRRVQGKYRWRRNAMPPHKPRLSANDISDAQGEP